MSSLINKTAGEFCRKTNANSEYANEIYVFLTRFLDSQGLGMTTIKCCYTIPAAWTLAVR